MRLNLTMRLCDVRYSWAGVIDVANIFFFFFVRLPRRIPFSPPVVIGNMIGRAVFGFRFGRPVRIAATFPAATSRNAAHMARQKCKSIIPEHDAAMIFNGFPSEHKNELPWFRTGIASFDPHTVKRINIKRFNREWKFSSAEERKFEALSRENAFSEIKGHWLPVTIDWLPVTDQVEIDAMQRRKNRLNRLLHRVKFRSGNFELADFYIYIPEQRKKKTAKHHFDLTLKAFAGSIFIAIVWKNMPLLRYMKKIHCNKWRRDKRLVNIDVCWYCAHTLRHKFIII